MNRPSGAARIFLYNWPSYALTWGAAVLVVVLARGSALVSPALVLSIGAVAWSLVSLAVSTYVYDRSRLVEGEWLAPLLPRSVRTWATIHAGLDEEIDVDLVMPGTCLARLDIFDKRIMTAPSIARARVLTPSAAPAIACPPSQLKLETHSCDAVIVAFAAHEIRDANERGRFFEEIHRALRPGGRAVVVEHLRDIPNFLAFGPGYFHFLARREWLRLGHHAHLVVAHETRITPWVMALSLEKPA